MASRISWNAFEKLFLPHLYAGRDTPGETLIKVYESKNKTVAKGWRGGSANTIQEAQRNYQQITSAPAHHRQQLEEAREVNEEAAEEQSHVPQEIVGNRTVPSHVIVDAEDIEGDDEVQIVAIRRSDNERAVREVEIASRERVTMAKIDLAKEEKLAEEATKQREAEKEEKLAQEATKQREAEKEEKIEAERTKQAAELTAQRQIELELARLAAQQTSARRPPTPPQQPRRKAVRPHAPAQIRPRAAANAIRRLTDYNITMLVQYVAAAFPDHGEIWETQIWDRFRRDQANPFLGFLPDNLSEQRTWLRSQLAQLVLNGQLRRSTYMGKASYSFP